MKSLFTPETYVEIEKRINNLSNSSTASWGKMDVAQMLCHCKYPLKIALRNKSPKIKPNILAKILFKKSMYNNRPWRKNLPTHPSLKITDQKVFDTEKTELLELVSSFYDERNKKEWNPHPIFGTFTPQQWGQLQYKHLDHHLKQFNV
ncbi:DUF1569 domain-containing protein [Aquimarina sp. 2201CG1-2-11]|uniref:DUF1569 domain-containing protein n=1 Tax=Aquimarina discodermiae TaxID=3231043 RepID=UPI003461AF00